MAKSKKKKSKGISQRNWFIIVIISSIFLSAIISLIADITLKRVDVFTAFFILTFIVALGVIFDGIGTAVTAASEKPFHAMAAKKVPGAKIAVSLVKNADKVSNFCSDVVGDICGIVSGASGLVIQAKLIEYFNITNVGVIALLAALSGALIAGATIGGKAIGKGFAMSRSTDIIYQVAKVINIFKKE